MKDIMKYYLQLITLVFCLFVSACSDDDGNEYSCEGNCCKD